MRLGFRVKTARFEETGEEGESNEDRHKWDNSIRT